MTAEFSVTGHFLKRMNQRGLNWEMVELVLENGRRIWARGTLYIFMGKRDAKKFGRLAERLEGIVIVVESKTRVMKTVFRNRMWTRKIRYD